jgi:hypothetical protein
MIAMRRCVVGVVAGATSAAFLVSGVGDELAMSGPLIHAHPETGTAAQEAGHKAQVNHGVVNFRKTVNGPFCCVLGMLSSSEVKVLCPT